MQYRRIRDGNFEMFSAIRPNDHLVQLYKWRKEEAERFDRQGVRFAGSIG